MFKFDSFYNQKRYWYHVSTTLIKKIETLIPWDNKNGENRCDDEPEGKRICVAPTIEQCITALPYSLLSEFRIYRTERQVIAKKARKVFDAKVTQEAWITTPTVFIKIGDLHTTDVEEGLQVPYVISQAGSEDNVSYSKEVLKWWQTANIQQFIKNA